MPFEGEDIAITQIAVYLSSRIVPFLVSLHYGFTRQSGWACLVPCCILRVAGVVIQILSVKHPTSRAAAQG